jgi:phage gpG-like protein
LAKKIPPGQVNKTNQETIKALKKLMKDLDKKVSIRVGIIGDKAAEKQPGSSLTNAELGAVHEFGATIKVTEKMRAYLHHIGIHLKPETTTITIPARSFLRSTLLSDWGKDELLGRVNLDVKDSEWNKEYLEYKLLDKGEEFFLALCEKIGLEAQDMVMTAFAVGGLPDHWTPISEVTRQNRKNDKTSPPLVDSGQLAISIAYEVKEL